MRSADKEKKHAEISKAAYELLETHGYAGCSMLRIAKAAKASNETLYRWYGSKNGLFTALIRDNAQEIRVMLKAAIDQSPPPLEALQKISPIFLSMLTGPRAISLNRAAAADETGELGAALAAAGRAEVMPLLARLIAPLCEGSALAPDKATITYLSLLVGDWQIRRVAHHIDAPSRQEIDARCADALAVWRQLL